MGTNRSTLLAKQRRVLIADYMTPIDAQFRQLNIHYSRLDDRIFKFYNEGTVTHQRLGTESVEFDLVEFPEKVAHHDVEREFTDSRLSKANITEQVAFSRLHPWKCFRLVALGTPVPRPQATLVPVLKHGPNGREFEFEKLPNYWEAGTVFLGVIHRIPNREYLHEAPSL